MRQILSISMPADMVKEVKNRVKKRGFDSISNYIKTLIKEDEDLISEDELLASVKKARRDYKQGKLKTLKTLKDLM